MATKNSNSGSPALTLPASEQIGTSGTVAVSGASYTDSFAQDNPGSLYLTISDESGALYGFYPASGTGPADAAGGSGSPTISFQGSYADVQDIINSLTYVAAGTGGTDDIHYDIWNQGGTETTGDVPVTITGSNASSGGGGGSTTGSDPVLTEPASETLAAGATQAISGSYSDSSAASNPGAMYLGITDSSGTLRATDASGAAVAGSGTNSITLNADYADVNAVLQSLTYTAGASGGSDSIHFDLWNQAGIETTDSVPVTITGGGGGGGGLTETWTGAVSAAWNTAGNWSGDAVPTSGDTVIIAGGTPHNATLSNATLTGETITLQASGTSTPIVHFSNVTLNSLLQSGNSGEVQIGGTLTVGAQGTLETAANATMTLQGTAETIVNNGLISGAAGGFLLIYNGPSTATAAARLLNNGSIVTDGGTINFSSTAMYPGSPPVWLFVNAGSVDIANGGGLVLNGTFQGGDVAFDGTVGSLALEQSMAFTDGATVSGFGAGDRLLIESAAAGQGGHLGFANGTLDVSQTGSLVQAIPLSGDSGFTLGNFEDETVAGPGNASIVVYAAGGQPSGQLSPEVVAPSTATVAQGSTLALNGVSIENLGTSGNLAIDASTGTLYMNGASGSGTHQLSLGPTSQTQMDADLASLVYVPAVGATADTVSITAIPPAPVATTRSIPISITGGGGGGGGPTLNEPTTETVAASGTIAVSGSYSDSFAAGNPGSLYLGITDSTGTLSATNASGQTVAGSGTDSIALQTDYVDVQAILASLHYTAGGSGGSDTIRFDVWNQAGVETTAATAVTIDPPGFSSAATAASSMTTADLAPVGTSSPGSTMMADTSNGSAGSLLLSEAVIHPVGMPLIGNG